MDLIERIDLLTIDLIREAYKDLKHAKKWAKSWSMDEKNNYGQAVVTKDSRGWTVSADVSSGVKIYAKYIDGKEVSISEAKKGSVNKWSGKVETHWTPPPGLFTKSANKIASGLKDASDNLKQAMSRLNFYINRAGKNLSDKDKKRLNNAKEKLRLLYGA
jgi:hypothetical protein